MKEQDIDQMPLGWTGGPVIRVGDKLYSDLDSKPYPKIVKRLYLDQQGSYAIALAREDGSGSEYDCGAFWHTSIELWRKARIERLRDEQRRIQRDIDKLLSEETTCLTPN